MPAKMSKNLTKLAGAIAKMEENRVDEILTRYLDEKVPPLEIIREMSAGMEEVGRLYKEGEYFLAELVFSGEIFKNAMGRVKPLLGDSEKLETSGKVVLGTVKDDIHDLGKNIVATLLECAGFEVIDLGVDVPPEKFVEALRDSGAPLVGMSILLTTAYESLKNTVDAIRDAGLREKVKIMIGGAVTNEKITDQMGVDYHGQDASSGVEIAREVFKA